MQKVGSGAPRSSEITPDPRGGGGRRQRRDAGPGSSASLPYARDDLGLSFYNTPPEVEVSIREFEDVTRDRLRVLHVFDRSCAYDAKLDNMSELKGKVSKELAESRLTLDAPVTSQAVESFPERKEEFVRRDAISHYALRLAFCKSREAREWFVRQEQRLFVYRFESLRPEAQEAFVAQSGLKCRKFDSMDDEKVNLQELKVATPAAKIWRDDSAKGRSVEWDSNFYTMHFTEVDPKLIAGRKVVVIKGTAYIPSVALKDILAKRYKNYLWTCLDVAFQGLNTALCDPRVGGFLRDLQDYGMQLLVAKKSRSEDVEEKLSTDNFEELMLRSFPPCMRRMVERQRETKKHLKHAGRLQLRGFLKECGFTIEDSYKWWRTELCACQNIDTTKFEKDYSYDLEHAYGKKGHLQGQNSFGCPKIIGFPSESAGQVHGCPFKNLEMTALKQQLHRWKVPEKEVFEMEKLINHGKHYQLGCIEYFKSQHPGHEGDGVGNSPGDFWRESCRYHLQKAEREKAARAAA